MHFSSRLVAVFAICLLSSCSKPESCSKSKRLESPDAVRAKEYGEAIREALRSVAKTNEKSKPVAVGAASGECALSEQLFNLIRSDELNDALALARSNMDSEDPKVRKVVADAFAWIGRRALPELAEMVEDSVPAVADTAADGWVAALDDIHNERVRGEELAKTLPKFKSRDHIEQALMQFASFNEDFAQETLAKIISQNEGTVLAECAREMYKHVSNGDPFTGGQMAAAASKVGSQTIKSEKTR